MATDEEDRRTSLADAAGRAAFFPARAAARAWRDQLELAVDEVLSSPESARVIDSTLAGSLPEEVVRSIVRHRVLERMVAELTESGELERLLTAALASPKTLELTDRVLASEQTQHALAQIMSSPAVRTAIARQTEGLAGEVVGGLRGSTERLDGRIEHAVSRRSRDGRPLFAGVATRALALATDAVLTILLYMTVVGVVSLISTLVGGLGPHWAVGTAIASGWVVIAGGYFVFFWSSAGQTPGMRLLRVRVRVASGAAPSVVRSIVRAIGLAVSIAVLFLGFVPVLFDRERRGLADFLAGTTVVYDDEAG
jgi:uncharacterized RDD family membrane protein YckC